MSCTCRVYFRFMTAEGTSKNRIVSPGRIMHFYNAPPDSTTETLNEVTYHYYGYNHYTALPLLLLYFPPPSPAILPSPLSCYTSLPLSCYTSLPPLLLYCPPSSPAILAPPPPPSSPASGSCSPKLVPNLLVLPSFSPKVWCSNFSGKPH